MKKRMLLWAVATLTFHVLAVSSLYAADILNPGFENGWQGWTDNDPSGSGTSISDVANNGESSVKLSEKSVYVAQIVNVQSNAAYRLEANVRGAGNLGVKVGPDIFLNKRRPSPKRSGSPSALLSSRAKHRK